LTADREHRVTRAVFVLSSLVTVVLFATPSLRSVAYPLLLLSTLVHEMGHGIAALLVGGSFVSFELWSDGSGVGHTTGPSTRLASAVVAAGGLIGPSIAAAISFLAGRRPGTARGFLGLLCLGLLCALVLLVRNTFGWIFVGGFALCLAVLVLKASPRASQVVLVFLGTQLALSVYSRGDYLFTAYAQTAGGGMPSDVQLMSNALLLPYWVWGLLCGAISVAALLVGVRTLWKAG
jgi:Peptidase M50B-like